MLYREAGQFRTTDAAERSASPARKWCGTVRLPCTTFIGSLSCRMSDAPDDLLAEQAFGPDQQEEHRKHVGGPAFDAAAEERADIDFRDFLDRAHDQAGDDD